MARAGMKIMEGPVELSYRAIYGWPSTWKQRDRDANGKWRIGRADVDNLAKLCLDGLEGVLYADDAQVVSLQVQKQYGLPCNEGVVITVTSLAEDLVEPKASSCQKQREDAA